MKNNKEIIFLKYKIEGSEDLTIATTRPETIFGDSAICVNPNDERFAHLKGRKAIAYLWSSDSYNRR
jgi:valyl-tRNA synthetase